jgi:hypothetical protein
MVFNEMQEQGINVCSFFNDYFMLLSVSRMGEKRNAESQRERDH